jgi:hypothetical protein
VNVGELTPHKIGTADEWSAARLALLAKEKEHARTADAIKAERRALPMTPVTKTYSLQSPDGPVNLKDLLYNRELDRPNARRYLHGILHSLPTSLSGSRKCYAKRQFCCSKWRLFHTGMQ